MYKRQVIFFATAMVMLVLLPIIVAAAQYDPFEELASPGDWDLRKPGTALMFAGTDPGLSLIHI